MNNHNHRKGDGMKTIACVGAHAMDAEVMGGAAAAAMVQKGWKALMIHMTRGERSHAEEGRESYASQLEQEMEQAARYLNSTAVWMGYKGGLIPDTAAEDLAVLIRKQNVDVLVTHCSGSYHPRHVQTHHVVRRAARLAADPEFKPQIPVHKVSSLFFGENLEDLEGFFPTVYVNISNVYDAWIQSLKSYELFRGGITKYPYDSYYTTAAITRGIEANVRYAQAFMLPRFLAEEMNISMEICHPVF